MPFNRTMKIGKYFVFALAAAAASSAFSQGRSGKSLGAGDLRATLRDADRAGAAPRQLTADERVQLRQQLAQGRSDSRKP